MSPGAEAASADHAQAQQALSDADAVMAALIERHGSCTLGHAPRDPFDTLISSIASQQLSTKAADTILGRVRDLADGRPCLQAPAVLALPVEALRACGLSGAKVRYVHGIAQACVEGRLDWQRLAQMDNEQGIADLCQLPGIGRWTAEMFLIFGLNRLDIFSSGDLVLQRSLSQLYGRGKPLSPAAVQRITRRWRPYRSVASWYLWRDADSETQTWLSRWHKKPEND